MYLYGASGHGKVIAEIAEENNFVIEAFIDQDQSKTRLLDYPIIHEIPNTNIDVIVSIGSNIVRKRVVNSNHQLNYKKLFHPKSIISKRVNINVGTVIMAGVTINSEVVIGKHCIINTNASIDHDCVFSDFVHISPNVSIAGNVEIAEGTHIGIGACIIQGIKIGKWCTIGAGTVVIENIPDYSTVVGNPGKIIKIKNVSDF